MQIKAIGEIYDMTKNIHHNPGDVFDECEKTAEILILKGIAVKVENDANDAEKTAEKPKRGRKKAIAE